MNVCVHKVVLPPVGAESWPYTNWFSYELIAQRHGLKIWSDAYWKMLSRYAAKMAHGRQNMFWVPLSVIFKHTAQGPLLDEPKLVRIVKTFTNAGLHWIEGGHWGTRTGGQWLSPTFDLTVGRAPAKKSSNAAHPAGVLATSVQGMQTLALAARQLTAAIERHGWRDRWVQHVADEPTGANANDYRMLAGAVRRYMPSLPIVDATMDPALQGAVDIWCPQAQEYQKHRHRFDSFRKLGDRVWFYTCCFPGGPWLNRLLDMELLRPALFGWAAALFDLDGYLHWGFNHYRPEQDPFHQSVVDHGQHNRLPAGDTHVVYPSHAGPYSSMRFEAQREGTEDLELLRLLAQSSAKTTRTLVRKVIQGFDRFTKDPKTLRAARRLALEAL